MPSWRPAKASDPDGADEWLYEDLAERDPQLLEHITRRYSTSWLRLADLDDGFLSEVGDTIDVRVHREQGTLRLTSWYTGTTYYGPDWPTDVAVVNVWIDGVADMAASNVRTDRSLYGKTPWDRS